MKRKKVKMGRLFSLLLAAALVFTALPETVHAHADKGTYPYSVAAGVYSADKWGFYQCECTSFAAYCINERNGFSFWNTMYGSDSTNKWGNANHWASVARLHGFTVDNNPAVGAIAWTNSGGYGHVAWVCAVNGDQVTIDEYNYGSVLINGEWHGNHRYNTRTVNKSSFQYIHIKDIVQSPAPAPEPERGQEVTGPFTRTISDGDYHIVSALGTDDRCNPGAKCLTIGGLPGNRNTSGSNAELWAVNGSPDHVFTVTWIDETHGYKIKLKSSANQYLDVNGADTALGANVQQWEGNNSVAQQWVIREMSDGNGYGIQARCSGYYLDVTDLNTADGTNIQLYKENRCNAQRWYFVPWGGGDSAVQSIPDGAYEIVSKMDSGKVLSTDGVNVAPLDRGDDDRHIFQTTYLGQGYYKITNKSNGMAMDVSCADSKNGTRVLLCGYWGSYNEQWLIKSCGDGYFHIMSRCNGLCVDVAGGGYINMWYYHGGDNQRWKFVPYKPPIPDNPDPVEPTPGNPEPDHPTPDKPGEDDNDQGEVLDEDIPDGGIAKIPHGLWMSEVATQPYTGKAVKPAVRVYDYKKLLTEKKDYTISYKNNTNAAMGSDAKAPTITVAGRGNYNGKDTQTFTITPKSLADGDVFSYDMAARYTGRVNKAAPTVVWQGRRLTKNKDYAISYPDGAYSGEGTYRVVVTGKGNFSGERTVSFTITRGKLASAFRVTKPANCLYTGEPVTPELTVKDGRNILTEGTDYKVTYRNNIEIGTAEALVTGIGNYAGVKTVSFKIMPAASLNKADAELMFDNGVIYTGNEVRPTACRVTLKGKDAVGNMITTVLTEGEDYEVTYQNNVKAGTATAVIRGINAYNGVLKKKYRIAAYDVGGVQFGVSMETAYAYVKGGCKPKPVVTFNGKVLSEGTDYTLRYRNNRKVSGTTGASPVVVIQGKGCFKGSRECSFRITPQEIGNLAVEAADRVWQNKANIYRTKVVIRDVDGKALSAGTDYDKNIRYVYDADTTLADGSVKEAGEEVTAADIIPADSVIRVETVGKGNYTGTITGIYRFVKADIAKAKVKIPAQTYTGKEIRPENEIQVKLNRRLLSQDSYEITGYQNNINTGTATLTLRGKNDCGGTKTVSFKIKRKGFRWWK